MEGQLLTAIEASAGSTVLDWIGKHCQDFYFMLLYTVRTSTFVIIQCQFNKHNRTRSVHPPKNSAQGGFIHKT